MKLLLKTQPDIWHKASLNSNWKLWRTVHQWKLWPGPSHTSGSNYNTPRMLNFDLFMRLGESLSNKDMWQLTLPRQKGLYSSIFILLSRGSIFTLLSRDLTLQKLWECTCGPPSSVKNCEISSWTVVYKQEFGGQPYFTKWLLGASLHNYTQSHPPLPQFLR